MGSPGRFFRLDGEPDVMEDPVIKEIAQKYNVTPAQVLTIVYYSS
jgi:diketogulonate reductase-like aldo/keto reductase